MKIYLVRHGRTVWNDEKRMQGWADSILSEKGRGNAESLCDSLKGINFDIIFSSPLNRAYETTNIIRGKRDINIIKDNNLKEINLGDWEGKLDKDIQENFSKQHYNFWNKPDLFKSQNGEEFLDVKRRAENFLNNIKNLKAENVLVVTHTVLIKCIYLIIRGDSIKNLWNPPYIYDTSLTIIYNNGKFSIESEADISHVSSLKKW